MAKNETQEELNETEAVIPVETTAKSYSSPSRLVTKEKGDLPVVTRTSGKKEPPEDDEVEQVLVASSAGSNAATNEPMAKRQKVIRMEKQDDNDEWNGYMDI